ncbi:DNA-deoxyinosine glycosylase [Serpentinicella sp. ANB-PHB4]|uniref:DNA-deoxyinosine glycosylase n=1 Tax=Serpentinicella sp. ANB-PHB4 TaxID=3074076 RepID=UPI0028635632|nr:DNA-deoxyinosine glycosylase [Serpentinicella sp. ANB-PHB4]MDR5659437.1 DNA-deoxyinosine glycosylase [Serpentinicella sp. ANB-PHB4]
MGQLKSFLPVIDHESKVLILGSMPGVKSLEENQYYGNARNHFWKIIYKLFNKEIEQDYNKKIKLLKGNKIALWDVINTCYRKGSLDANIIAEQPNDIVALLEEYPNIKFVGFNGTKAFTTYKKHIGIQSLTELEYAKLPSTSPIPGKNIKTLEEKIESWSIILDYIH